MDGGSIPPISTNHCHVEEAPRNHALPGSEGLLLSKCGLLERREDLLHLCDLGGLVADDLLGERDGVSVLPG